jgi:uncharacterized membrane protein
MELKAKNASLVAKIVAGVIVVAGAVLKWLHIFDCTVNELSVVAFTVAGLFGTVDVNLMFEKIWGKGNVEEK